MQMQKQRKSRYLVGFLKNFDARKQILKDFENYLKKKMKENLIGSQGQTLLNLTN